MLPILPGAGSVSEECEERAIRGADLCFVSSHVKVLGGCDRSEYKVREDEKYRWVVKVDP